MNDASFYRAFLLGVHQLNMDGLHVKWKEYVKSLVCPSGEITKMPSAHKFVIIDKRIFIAPIDLTHKRDAFYHADIAFLAKLTGMAPRNQLVVGSGAIDIRGKISSWQSHGGLPETPKKLRPTILDVLHLEAKFKD